MFFYFKISQRMRQRYKSWPALIVSLPALITPCPGVSDFTSLLVNKFPNELAPKYLVTCQENHLFVLLLHF